MNRFIVVLTFCAFTLVLPHVIHAETNGKPVVTVKVDKKEMVIGDHLKYDVNVLSPADLAVVFPALEEKLGHFDILSRSRVQKKVNFGKQQRISLNLVISVYDRGEYTLPAFPVMYIDKSGTTNVAVSEAVKVKVNGVLSGRISPKLRDVKQQERLADPFLWLKILLLLLLAAGGYLLYRFRDHFFKKKLLPVIAKLEPELPPDIEALNRLNDVVQRDVLGQSGLKEYYSIINEIIRHYLHRVYGLVTLERTTDEIVSDMRRLALSSSLHDVIADFLMDSDLVKFAKSVPSKNEINGFLEIAFSIIEQTKPKVVQPAGEEA